MLLRLGGSNTMWGVEWMEGWVGGEAREGERKKKKKNSKGSYLSSVSGGYEIGLLSCRSSYLLKTQNRENKLNGGRG